MTRIDTRNRPQNLGAPPQWAIATFHRFSRPQPTSTRQEAEETRFAVDGASTTTRGGADTAERQHLHASDRVSFLQLLILPTPDRNDISFLSNLHQRWAPKMPLHRMVPLPPAVLTWHFVPSLPFDMILLSFSQVTRRTSQAQRVKRESEARRGFREVLRTLEKSVGRWMLFDDPTICMF